MASPSDPFWQYDFDDAYFNSNDDDMDISSCGNDKDIGGSGDDMDIGDCDDDMDIGVDIDSNHDSEEEEFWFAFPLIGKMVAYFQWHYNKHPMRISILSGRDYGSVWINCLKMSVFKNSVSKMCVWKTQF